MGYRTMLFVVLLQVGEGMGQIRMPGLDQLCPEQNVCRETSDGNNTDDVHVTTSPDGCCTECSCEPSCSNNGNCCFPAMNANEDINYEECLHTEIFPPNSARLLLTKSYYMVVKEPLHGCVQSFESQHPHRKPGSCCEDDVTPWGSLFPFWSPGMKKIYKNKLYADCHGANDTIPWTAIQSCSEVNYVTHGNDCNVLFMPPIKGDVEVKGYDDIRKKQCFMDMVSKCPADFKIRRKFAFLTKSEIINGCESDFVSAHNFGHSVKNVYCYLCIYSPYTTPDENQCKTLPSGKSPLSSSYPFSFIIDADYLLHYIRARVKTSYDMACRRVNGQIDQTSCREVLCPTGQTFYPSSNECVFASREWQVNHCLSQFTLTIERPTKEVPYEMLLKGDIVLLNEISSDWTLQAALIPFLKQKTPYNTNSLKQVPNVSEIELYGVANQIVVILLYTYRTVDPIALMEEMKNGIAKKWSLTIGNVTLTASAHIDHALFRFQSGNTYGQVCTYSHATVRSNNGSWLFNESQLFLRLPNLGRRAELQASLFISKLYFCRQVKLEADEFIVFSVEKPLVLLVLLTNHYLYEKEFQLQQQAGYLTALVCLEDSGYTYLPSMATMLHLSYSSIILLLSNIAAFVFT